MHLHVMTALLLTAVGACDPARFTNPLPQAAKLDPKLAGTWGGRDSETEFTLFIEPTADHFDVLLVGRGPKDGVAQVAWEALPATINGKTYLSMREKSYSDAMANTFTLSPTYMLVRYELKGDVATFAYLPNFSLNTNDGGTQLSGATSAELATGLQALPPKAFESFITVKRFTGPKFKVR